MVNKIKCNDKIDILYSLDTYNGTFFDLKTPFKYSGIYDKENNKLYDIDYFLRTRLLDWDYNDDRSISSSELHKKISQDMNDKINELIVDNKNDIFNIEEVELAEDKIILNRMLWGTYILCSFLYKNMKRT